MHNHIGHKSPSLSCGRMRTDKRAWHFSCDEVLRENVTTCRLVGTDLARFPENPFLDSFLLADNALREAHALEVVTEMPRVGHLN